VAPQSIHPSGPPPGYAFATDQQLTGQPSPEEGPAQGQFPQQPQGGERSKQQPPVEILQPQATRPVTGQQEGGAFLHAPQSATQSHGPPSPFPGQQGSQPDQPEQPQP